MSLTQAQAHEILDMVAASDTSTAPSDFKPDTLVMRMTVSSTSFGRSRHDISYGALRRTWLGCLLPNGVSYHLPLRSVVRLIVGCF